MQSEKVLKLISRFKERQPLYLSNSGSPVFSFGSNPSTNGIIAQPNLLSSTNTIIGNLLNCSIDLGVIYITPFGSLGCGTKE